MSNPRVFISYSHDSDEHRKLVRGLHASLSRDGCDCQLDVYKDTDEDWPTWMARQLEEADFVLCVITETYERRFKDQELPTVGLGVGWEAGLIRRLLYAKKLHNDRIFPAVFARENGKHIPLELQGYDIFALDGPAGYEVLLRKIIKQPEHVRPATGTAPDLGSSTTAPLFARPNTPTSGVAGVERSEPPADAPSNETGGSLHSTPATRIINSQSKLPHTTEKLIGRETELAMLDGAWDDAHKNVVVVRGKGGEGKTSLVASWMAELAMKDWRGAEWVLDWSFYSQGTRDQSTASGEAFIISALGHFGDPKPNEGGAGGTWCAAGSAGW